MSVVKMVNHFPRIAAGLPDACEAGVRQVAVEIADEAAQRAPVDTGALKATCTAEPLSRGELGLTNTVGVSWAAMAGDTDSTGLRPDGRPVNYAVFQEFGTRFMAAQPFFFPAVEHLRGEFPGIIETSLSVRLRELTLSASSSPALPGSPRQDLSGFGG